MSETKKGKTYKDLPMTHEEIGKLWGVSSVMIRTIEKRALRKLKENFPEMEDWSLLWQKK